jgi:hypothetical protein
MIIYNERRRTKLRRNQKNAMKIIPKASPPNDFIGGPVPNAPGFPLKACGNDGLRIDILLNEASCGEFNPRRVKEVSIWHGENFTLL